MYLIIEENPNAAPEERVFATSGPERGVKRLNVTSPKTGETGWFEVIAVENGGVFKPARVQRVDDSADGTAWLVFGGDWGLRLRATGSKEEWSLSNPHQWGVPFLVLDQSGSAIEFA